MGAIDRRSFGLWSLATAAVAAGAGLHAGLGGTALYLYQKSQLNPLTIKDIGGLELIADLPESAQLAISPKSYTQQEPAFFFNQLGGNCGAHIIYHLLEMYDEVDEDKEPKDYLFPPWGVTGNTLPTDIHHMLGRHGIEAPLYSAARLTDEEKIAYIKSVVAHGDPLVLATGYPVDRLGDGYQGELDPGAAHWVVVEGYEGNKAFIYDPRRSILEKAADLPIGNEEIDMDILLNMWKHPFLATDWFVAIPISKPN